MISNMAFKNIVSLLMELEEDKHITEYGSSRIKELLEICDSNDEDDQNEDNEDEQEEDSEDEQEEDSEDETTAAAFLTSGDGTPHGYQGAYEDGLHFDTKGDAIALVRGQKTGRDDWIIHDSIEKKNEVHIIYRLNSKSPFTYIGKGMAELVSMRTSEVGVKLEEVEHMTLFKIRILKKDIVNEVCRPVENTQFKLGALRHIGYQHTNIMTCFYKQ